MTNPRPLPGAALLLAALTLAACGGGSPPAGGTGTPPGAGTPSAAGPGGILEDADTLLMTGLHARWSLSGGGETVTDSFAGPVSCSGARCVGADGTETAVADLRAAYAGGTDLGAAEAATGTRGGFGTATATGSFEVSETLEGVALTVSPEVTGWGFWGAHGFAVLTLGEGTVAATVEGAALSGEFSMAQAWAAGGATGANPAGTGRATWRGIAEASPKGAFRRVAGTATVTVPDLSRPRVDVGIDLAGADGTLRWAGMALAGGRFAKGVPGTDRVQGGFHGPAREEAWGVFDTTGWIGAFGARRAR